MACCLTAPSHYLKQSWLIICAILWNSHFGHRYSKLLWHFPGAEDNKTQQWIAACDHKVTRCIGYCGLVMPVQEIIMVITCISKIYTRQHERCEKLIYSWVYCFYFQGSEVPEVQPDVTNTNPYHCTNGASVLQKKPLQVSNQVTTKLDGGVSL